MSINFLKKVPKREILIDTSENDAGIRTTVVRYGKIIFINLYTTKVLATLTANQATSIPLAKISEKYASTEPIRHMVKTHRNNSFNVTVSTDGTISISYSYSNINSEAIDQVVENFMYIAK